jgi:pyruvate-ferredoxin/flavodoxin oxidoreductase
MYVLRSTIGLPGHLLPGLKAGLESRRAAVFHLHVCEPSSDGVLPDRAVNSMRAAVESRAFPVLAYDPDKSGEWADRWDLSGNPSIEDYWPVQTVETSLAGRPTKRNAPFTLADWAVRQGKFRNHFRHVPRNAWSSQMLPLTEFLELAPDERHGKEPYVEIVDVQGHVGRAGVEPAMVVATEASLRSWMLLQELAGIRSSVAHRISTRLSEEFEIEIGRLREELRADFAQKATAERQSFESEVHLRLTQELLALSAYGPGTERAHTRLAEFAAGRGSDDGDE